jgi:cytochrome subunit of sulfide dehydrogenase
MLKRSMVIAVLICIGGVAQAAGIDAIVKDCEGCHGANGASQWSDMPTIAGISAGVHADYLFTYRDKARPCTKSKYRQGDTKRPETDMCAVASKLSDADIEALAAHFAAKPFVRAKQTFDPAKAAAGQKIHARDCEKCHSGNGKKAADDASILAGQWMPYLKSAMAEFNSGKRPQPKKMKEKMDKLKADEIEALVHFYASVP